MGLRCTSSRKRTLHSKDTHLPELQDLVNGLLGGRNPQVEGKRVTGATRDDGQGRQLRQATPMGGSSSQKAVHTLMHSAVATHGCHHVEAREVV